MSRSTIKVSVDHIAKVTADLVKEEVLFESEQSVSDPSVYVIEFTGGY